jgi:hypothetical protein
MNPTEPLRRPRLPSTASAWLSGAALSVLLTACGGGSDNPPGAETPTTPARVPFACRPPATAPSGTVPGSNPGRQSLRADRAPATAEIDADLRQSPLTTIPFVRYDLRGGMSYSYGFAVHDFDCDGQRDISFFDSYARGRSVFRTDRGAIGYIQWNGGAQEQIAGPDEYRELPQPPSDVVLFERHIAMDVNGDNRPDIVGVVNSHSGVVAYLNPGFRDTPWQRQVLSAATPGAVNLVAGDLDGDGDLDIAVVMREQPGSSPNPTVRGLVWLENPGRAGAPWTQRVVEGSGDLVDPRTLQIADLDGDGRADIVVTDTSTGVLSWYRRSSNTAPWERHDVPDVLTVHAHFGIALDVDGDGRIDLLLPTYQGITWVRNLGNGQFSPIPIARFAAEDTQIVVSELAVGDIDLDGRLDIAFVVSSLSPSQSSPRRGGVYWLRQGDLVWELNRVLYEDSATVGVQLVDYDGDGDLDLVTNTEYQANVVTLWLNDLR